MVTLRAAKSTQLAKYYGAQYTSPSAARLLAHLAINLPCPLRWQSIPLTYAGEPFRVVDFACGDGALLLAVYDELADRVRAESGGERTKELHRYLLEDGLWGFDVQSDPVRAAASRLSSHNPQVAAEPLHLFILPLGKSGRHIALGSLDLLRRQQRASAEPVGEHPDMPRIPEFHLAIMNPPFTRSVGGNLVFGDLPRESRRALQKELRHLLHDEQLEGTGQAGLAAAFLGLANRYLRPGGRLAMVLPKTLLSGVAWRGIRNLLLNTYHIEGVVASFEAPNAWNFSERTSLSEVLLLARKHPFTTGNAGEEYTIFVNLWRKPATEQEVASVSSQVLALQRQARDHRIEEPSAPLFELRCSGEQVGEGYATQLTTAEFGHYQLFAQGALNRTVTLLRSGTLCIPTIGVTKSLTLTPITQFVESIGPDVRQVHTAFQSSQSLPTCDAWQRETKYNALWNHDSTRICTMAQSANATLVPRDEEMAKRLWDRGSARLLVAERAWLTTVRTMAALTPEPVLSNVWWPIRVRATELRDGSRLDPRTVAQLLALWINSTLGLLLLLSQAETTRGPWVKFKKRPLHELPVVDFSQLQGAEINRLRHTYNEVHQQQLQPLPLEFATPRVRRRIDNAFDKALRLDTDLTPLYRLLAQDPTITCEALGRTTSKKRVSPQTAL
jgi:hypothetical protein